MIQFVPLQLIYRQERHLSRRPVSRPHQCQFKSSLRVVKLSTRFFRVQLTVDSSNKFKFISSSLNNSRLSNKLYSSRPFRSHSKLKSCSSSSKMSFRSRHLPSKRRKHISVSIAERVLSPSTVWFCITSVIRTAVVL